MRSSGCGHRQVSGHQVTLWHEQCGLQLRVKGWKTEASSDHWGHSWDNAIPKGLTANQSHVLSARWDSDHSPRRVRLPGLYLPRGMDHFHSLGGPGSCTTQHCRTLAGCAPPLLVLEPFPLGLHPFFCFLWENHAHCCLCLACFTRPLPALTTGLLV